MSDSRKRLSGCDYRKWAREKNEKMELICDLRETEENSQEIEKQSSCEYDADNANHTYSLSTNNFSDTNIDNIVTANISKSDLSISDDPFFWENNNYLHNGEKISGHWLIYSEITESVYCGPCLAFNGGTQFGSKNGFDDWKNIKRIEQHENSKTHKNCLLSLKARAEMKRASIISKTKQWVFQKRMIIHKI
ncbi:hypothetical protein TSAR_016050 [Trichomalopsis sarcophagae]|uniref:TTF-type domain-containing protein n=1 Tax=Trichomalopsis sarcophagae TaxID=543379 RepID=A0A232EH99_9HYME|nr:hypothetical protein TSAR_016050 [Trichomalopsis sarcophagae]